MPHFLDESTPPATSYTKEFIEQSKDFPMSVQRLFTFVDNNIDEKYVSTLQNNLLVFDFKSCKCNLDECSVCQGKDFPPYGMNN